MAIYYLRQGLLHDEYAIDLAQIFGGRNQYISKLTNGITKVDKEHKLHSGFITLCIMTIRASKFKSIFRSMAARTLRCIGAKTYTDEIIDYIGKSFKHSFDLSDRNLKTQLVQDWISEMTLLCDGEVTLFYDKEMQSLYRIILDYIP
jgi:hypothetical protein